MPTPTPRRDFEVKNRLVPLINMLVDDDIIGENDIYCMTHIIDGEVRANEIRDKENITMAPDYLMGYLTEQGFDFLRLINDDYFEAIHLLWKNRKFISCLKLVLSAIDTLAIVEYGPGNRNCLKLWLDKYCELESLGVT